MNYNTIVFIGFIIMIVSVLSIALSDDDDFSKFGWLAFCVGLVILGVGAILNLN